MFCPKCGNQVKEGVRFCTKCGAAMGTANGKRTVRESGGDTGKAPVQPVKEPQFKTDAVQKRKKGPVVPLLVVLLLLILGAGGGIFYYAKQKQTETKENERREEARSIWEEEEETEEEEAKEEKEAGEEAEAEETLEEPTEAAVEAVAAAETVAAETAAEAESAAAAPAYTLSYSSEVRFSGYRKINIQKENTMQSSHVVQQNTEIDNTAWSAFDGQTETSWQEGADGNGEGEGIAAGFGRVCQVNAVTLLLGNHRSETWYLKNNRPKVLTIHLDDQMFQIEFPDIMREFAVVFSSPVPASQITIFIDEVYRGTEYEDTVIAEIGVYEG